MGNIAETVKKQTDRILRQKALNGTDRIEVSGIATGTGAPAPTVNSPAADLTAHKTSSDHDGRYYTEDEVDGLLAAMQGLFAEVYRDTFSNEDSIVVTHNLGKRPVVQAIGQSVTAYGAGLYGADTYGGINSAADAVLTPSSIIHDSINQLTVTLAAAATGEVVCIG